MADETNSVPTPDDTRTIDNELPPESKLKTLVVDLFVWKKTDAVLETHPDSWNEGFLRELVVRLKRMPTDGKSFGAPWRSQESRCERYHEHPAMSSETTAAENGCCAGRCDRGSNGDLQRKRSAEFRRPKKVIV